MTTEELQAQGAKYYSLCGVPWADLPLDSYFFNHRGEWEKHLDTIIKSHNTPKTIFLAEQDVGMIPTHIPVSDNVPIGTEQRLTREHAKYLVCKIGWNAIEDEGKEWYSQDGNWEVWKDVEGYKRRRVNKVW